MVKRLGAVTAAIVLAASVVACGDEEGPGEFDIGGPGKRTGESAGDVQYGPDGMPVGPDGEPLGPQLDGVYELSSAFDLTTAGLLPDVMNDTLRALSNFREEPSQTIVDLMDAANVPLVPKVLNSIPAGIRGFVLGYIDEHVFGALYKSFPVTERITGMLDDLASIVTKFELVTSLDLPQSNSIGDVWATHEISGVGFRWDETRHVVRAPELLSDLVRQRVDGNVVALEKRSPELESGRLLLGDHTFSVPVGSFALYAVDEFVKDKFGANNLRDVVGTWVNCKKLAANVAARCVGAGAAKVCVGHAAELEQVCSVGLDLLVGAVRGGIKKLDIPFLNLQDGFARMWDAPEPGGKLDAVVDRIDNGFWTAFIRVKKEDRPVVATFTGHRIGDTEYPSR